MGKASEYRKKLAERRAKRESEEVLLPSGETWLLKRPDFQTFIMSGRCPQALVNRAIDTWKSSGKFDLGDAQAAVRDMDGQSILDMLEFVRLMVCEACTEPRVMLQGELEDAKAKGIDVSDVLLVTEIDSEDRQFIFNWAVGGVASDGLASFRGGQERGASGAGDDGAELRPETVSAAAN
jgi:hypothetical protein